VLGIQIERILIDLKNTSRGNVKEGAKEYHRRSIRLRSYDYSQPGMYYVTLVLEDRVCTLGEIVGGEVRLSKTGQIVKARWEEIPNDFENVILDQYVIMPNHVHGVLILKDFLVGTRHEALQEKIISRKGFIHETPSGKGLMNQTPTKNVSPGWPLMADSRVSLGKVVRAFKAKSAKTIHDLGRKEFQWQRNFYDHVHPVR